MKNKISEAFKVLNEQAPQHAKAWSEMVFNVSKANVLDAKTTSLIYISILAVLGLENGIAFHVEQAKKNGATKQEIIHAVLLGLAPAGHKVTQALPKIIECYDNN